MSDVIDVGERGEGSERGSHTHLTTGPGTVLGILLSLHTSLGR